MTVQALRPLHRTCGLLTTAAAVIPIPTGAQAVKLYCSTLTKFGSGKASAYPTATQQQQTITGGDATSGNYTLTFQGQTTGNIAYNASAATHVTGLTGLSSIGTGGVTGSGGVLGTNPIVITFVADILDGEQPLLVPTTVDLAGGASASSRLPTVAITTPSANSTGFVEAGTEFLFGEWSTDVYLYLKAVAGTGVYRATWLG